MPHRPTLLSFSKWLNGRTVTSVRSAYQVIEANQSFVIFSPTIVDNTEQLRGTGHVMLPTELVLEWIHAYHDGRIDVWNHDPRAMREIAKVDSPWASQLHSFETHLAAIVRAWAESDR